MVPTMKEFTIRSIELRNYDKKHLCQVVKIIDNNKLLVRLLPSIPGFVYESAGDFSHLVLAPRYEGTTLVPEISEWPCYVNICIPEKADNWESGPFSILDIGLLEISDIKRDT